VVIDFRATDAGIRNLDAVSRTVDRLGGP